MKRAPYRFDEDKAQAAIVAWVRVCAPRCMIFAVPNGFYVPDDPVGRGRQMSFADIEGIARRATRRAAAARQVARLKHTGMLPGAPDLVLLAPDGFAAFIETKALKGSLSDRQREFQGWCSANGHRYLVARSVDDVRHALTGWGIWTREAA